MPNWTEPGSDCPSREDLARMEREQRDRDRELTNTQNRVDQYLRNHPNASWAEAEFNTRRK